MEPVIAPQQLTLIESADGTSIARWRAGRGAPLVAVHGVTIDHTCWDGLRPAIETRRTLIAIDRRGHGASGDGDPAHTLQQEVEDLLAVLEDIGGPLDVLGHSYGGLVALEAALTSRQVRRLAVYEPSVDDDPDFPDVLERVGTLVAAGDYDHAAETLLIERSGVPADMIHAVRELPLWPILLRGVRVLPREGAAMRAYRFTAERLAALGTPTVVIVGEQSPDWRWAAMKALHAALPDSELRALPGQGHLATHTAPDLLASEILGFLDAP